MSVPWYLMAKGKGGGGYKTASGPIVSINDALAAPLRSLVANIEPVQAGSGDPSPDNVRPISGWSTVNVWRTGKNLLNSSIVHGIWTVERWYSHEGYNTTYLSTRYAVPVVGGKTYCFSLKNDSSNPAAEGFFIAFTNGNAISKVTWFNIAKGIINVPSGADSIAINIILTNNIESISDVSATDFQLEPGSIASPYAPYSGNQYTLQLGDTYYGGTLDVTNGVLAVDRAMVDLGTLNYGYNATYKTFSAYKGDIKAHGMCISSQYKYGDGIGAPDMTCCLGYTGWFVNNILIKDSRYTDAATFKAAMSGVQLVYELATPITIPLTATEISSLQGENNVWADSGDVTVEYLASGGANADLMKLAVAFMGRK